ncbi:ankyrin repeat and LEM domain-containing protein 1 [Pelmatolapia mariae]|uniref:ankyrin repeat and LEM domain-containing protein 1 n=1 Tax=Pelmatolapia mariae TaxID=158779 RepID=UPI002FE66480
MDRHTRRLTSQLCKAVNEGDPRSVQQLLLQGANPNLVGTKGVAAVHLSVGKETEKNTRCLKTLLQYGADPNIRSSEGLTPLHVAALWGCYQNLKLLLMNGGNPNIKDNEGNTPQQLAEQQENQKCAHLLQEYQASPTDTEEEDIPQFQYSLYSDQTDMSSYPESDYSFSSHTSMISDFGEAPLSSTRRSSFFNLSNINGRLSCRSVSHRGPSYPSILSSTRMSAVEPAAAEDGNCTDDTTSKREECPAAPDGIIPPSNFPAVSSMRASRKSVSFRDDVDEYYPVFSPESPQQNPAVDGCQRSLPFDISEYSDFLDSERMATILDRQGIDATSPDHVYIFCRESTESTEEDLEKTVLVHCALEESDDEQKTERVKDSQGNSDEKKVHCHAGGSSSGTSSSHYSSCESDHYTSALDASVNPECLSLSAADDVSAKTALDRKTLISTNSDCELTNIHMEANTDSKPQTVERLSGMLNKLTLSGVKNPNNDIVQGCGGNDVTSPSKGDVVEFAAVEEKSDHPFTPSPFVTGRTRSRMSRCSLRTSRTPESLSSTSSLFEDTLPTPVRTRRQTPRSPTSEEFYNSPRSPFGAQCFSGRRPDGGCLSVDCQETQSSTVRGSSVSNSQADTLLLSTSVTDSAVQSQTLCDTFLLESNNDSSVSAYERNLAEIALAMREQNCNLTEDGEFLTDDLTSSDETTAKRNVNDTPHEEQAESLNNEDAWITRDCSSLPDSVSSSSTSSYGSPRRSKEDSDFPCTPGTGCTPRYSMSRLSSCRRPQHLANLSYTPGGRPHIQDVDEPVEYLYTDTERGHKLIETHVPPTADTSLSSSVSTTSSEETILYDWRSLHADMVDKIRGLTDKELRSRLVELGESPGPISSRTRPTYMRRLCRLVQESNYAGYSPELCRVLETFNLPNCQADEQALCQQFDQPDQNRKWREGVIKSSFNYLLLDPRVTKNLPFRSHTMTPKECFQTFIHAIFYVGKGKRSRPYSHLYEALEYFKGDKTSKKLCSKVQHILQVWNTGQGVISLHCFQNVIPVEAYTREACMVEAIGLKMLTNQKRGDFYGIVSNWQTKKKRELGIHLLYRAMQIFLAEGERQLRPADIRQ